MRKIFAIIAVGLFAGCATSQQVEMRYIGSYPIDCANKYKHLKNLETMLTGKREYDALVKLKIWNLESECENIQPRKLEVLQ